MLPKERVRELKGSEPVPELEHEGARQYMNCSMRGQAIT